MKKVLQLVDSPDGVFQRLGLPLVDPVPDKSVQVERLARALHDMEQYPFPLPMGLSYKDLTDYGKEKYLEKAKAMIEYMDSLEVE